MVIYFLLLLFSPTAPQVVIEEATDACGNLELQERVTRRFSGRFSRLLPWQEEVQTWAANNVGLQWDEEVTYAVTYADVC
jgi:hypothetical protein